MKKMFCAVLVIAMMMFAGNSGIAVAGSVKIDVCHNTGNGGYQLINISTRALNAHLGHEDILPGEIISVEEPYDGLYGSTVTMTTLIGPDCSTTTVLKIETTQNFSSGQAAGVSAGWAGWSCVEPGHPKVVGGGVFPEDGTIIAQGPAKLGAAAISGWNYPVYPHFIYIPPEEGWVVEAAGETPPTGIYVLCGP